MIVQSTINEVMDGYSSITSSSNTKTPILASVLLASDENRSSNDGLFGNGIVFQGAYFWFASIPMMIACFNHHAKEMNLNGELSKQEQTMFLSTFADKGNQSLCWRYRELYAIKISFRNQVNSKNKLLLSDEEWCAKWFRSQKRGIGTEVYGEMLTKGFNRSEIIKWVRTIYNTGGGITLRSLIEARDNPDFVLVDLWTKNVPCLWLDKLVPHDHELAKNLGQWVRFTDPSPEYGYQFYPYRLIHLQYSEDGGVIYHAENQLTLPEGIRVRTNKVTLIKESESEQIYTEGLKTHPYKPNTWGSVAFTSLWNPKKIDFVTQFSPNLNETNWAEFSKCDEYTISDGRRDYSKSEQNPFNESLSGGSKQTFVAHMDYLRSLSAKEYTFYKKFKEICSDDTLPLELRTAKDKIWKPRDIRNKDLTVQQIGEIQPEIIFVRAQDELFSDWRILRTYVHTMEYEPTPARMLRILIRDTVSGKYLGVASIASDLLVLAARQKYIGSIKNRSRHSAVGSCIMATQPFGFNFLGGKLIASLLTTKTVRDKWKECYGDILVGLTTTSLYGSGSMYDDIPWWHDCGESEGKVTVTPDKGILAYLRERIKEDMGKDYKSTFVKANGMPVTASKQKLINLILKKYGLKQKDYNHCNKRGVYYSLFYKNGREFFAEKITESQLVPDDRFQNDVQGVMDWWKQEAMKRYLYLHKMEEKGKKGRLKPETLFYDRIRRTASTGVSYEEARAMYFKEVGR